jgi:hypothetical protein
LIGKAEKLKIEIKVEDKSTGHPVIEEVYFKKKLEISVVI